MRREEGKWGGEGRCTGRGGGRDEWRRVLHTPRGPGPQEEGMRGPQTLDRGSEQGLGGLALFQCQNV